MTTIAAKKASNEHPASIACDLQVTYGSSKLLTLPKITLVEGAAKQFFNAEKAYVGYSGITSHWSKARDWLLTGEGRAPRVKLNLLALTDDGRFFCAEDSVVDWFEQPGDYCAIGSGTTYALAAMASGKSPIEAVVVASQFDIYSGMGSKEFSF